MNTAVKQIEKVLTSEYRAQYFVELINEIFGNIHFVAPNGFIKEYSNFSSHIVGHTHIGNYSTPEGKKIVFLSVRLKKDNYVENSRSTQRSYAKKLIEAGEFDAAIVAFYTEGDPKWRLSFVRLDYEMKIENGKLRAAENLTPAKRYSFLVGKNEPCHTAVERFRLFIINEGCTPSIDDIEDAFSVEKVTSEFFNLYCEKYHQLREHLDSNEEFVEEANQHNFTSEQFAKKLMGQIVFLYFLQKKGWLGVKAWKSAITEKEYKNAFYARGAKSRELIPVVYKVASDGLYHVTADALEQLSDEDEEFLSTCVKGNPWGSGPQNFMRKLYELALQKNANFYDDFLEPLFYNALNKNRGEQGYCPALHCRVPFLSGGLFDPIDGYEWEHNNFDIPNELFSNASDDLRREADGILDIFDRYNFTMSEDEPLEREVAIDPEMLGKVFENLLEVTDRKSKGAFYTPREIVHYMCQESLINYLVCTTGISEAGIRDFILYGDFMKDEDTVKEKRNGNGGMYISDEIFKINELGEIVTNRLKDIDDALISVRVADPAVGSGAFPLGMLNEIVRARQNITAYLAIGMNKANIHYMYSNDRAPHRLKYETIKNCIFAADIEPSAVDIAQLRLWLSLVIDDEINPEATNPLEGHRNPLPLPNLECNIICGNSLVDRFEGVELLNDSDLVNIHKSTQMDINRERYNTFLEELLKAQNELFGCDEPSRKEQIKEKIQACKNLLVETQLDSCSDELKLRFSGAQRLSSKPYVLWQIDFARVFCEKGGFDIVIGNPPYIQLQKSISDTTKLGDLYMDLHFDTFAKTGDIYCLFYEKGYSILHENGILSFITSNKWMRAGYGKPLRGFLSNKTNPITLLDFAGTRVFESATVDVNILIFSKSKNEEQTFSCTIKDECQNNLSVYVKQNGVQTKYSSDESWTILSTIEQSIKKKIETIGTPLKKWNVRMNYGIKTGFNEAFIISEKKKDELISSDPKSAEIIRPILRGRDIKRYHYEFADLFLIATFPSKNYNIDDYPAIKEFFLSIGYERLEQSGKTYTIAGESVHARKKTNNKWFETQDSISYWDDFTKQKIVYREISDVMDACIVESDIYVNNKCYILTGESLEYLLCIFNSKLFNKIILSNVNLTGGKGVGFLGNVRIPVPSEDVSSMFRNLYAKITDASPENTSCIEDEIDNAVFNLYGLSDEERKAVSSII